jgi:hydrogenase-4 membrane subunit HyfE
LLESFLNFLQENKETLKLFLDFWEVLLILVAIYVTTTPTIKHMIIGYRWQSFFLTFGVVLAAMGKLFKPAGSDWNAGAGWFIVPIALLPLALSLFIRPVLARATLSAPLGNLFRADKRHQLETEAERIWLSQLMRRNRQYHIGIAIILVIIAFGVAFMVASNFSPSGRIGLAVSLALHLIGLYNMIIKQDIISQVIGLLTMDHGLYLAVVKIVTIPVPASAFVIGLYGYTLITLFILLFLLPKVRSVTESIDLSVIADTTELKG